MDEAYDEVITSEENDTNVGELQVVDLYNEHDNKIIEEFNNNITSTLDIKLDYDKTDFSLEWLEIMEDTIRYIDNILRNPNRFIINEEEVVKVELARRITVDSIKHLARNTNLIQKYDKKNGDIKPSKILNINKEENFNTYENRFIYSLIKNMKAYINFKKKAIEGITNARDDKKVKYSAETKVGTTKYNLMLSLDSSIDTNSKDENNVENILKRVEKVDNKVTDLMSTELYRTIDKLHITLVTSPIKKTNVILKNTNFQYAVKLWNYMQEHMGTDTSNYKDSKEEKVEGKIKNYSDEAFLLEYLILDTYTGGKGKTQEKNKKEISKKIINSMLQKLLEMDSIDKQEILDLIDRYYTVVKYKNVVNDKEIHDKFKACIDDYLSRFNSLNLE